MAAPTIAIISKNDDFSSVLAEHAERELGVKIVRADAAEKIKTADVQLVITSELFENRKPLRLQDILADIKQRITCEEWPLADAVVSVQQKTISRQEKSVSLTDKETQLLLMLLKHKTGVTKEALLKDIWGVETELESHTLETHVYRLRAKLKEIGVQATIAAGPGKYALEL